MGTNIIDPLPTLSSSHLKILKPDLLINILKEWEGIVSGRDWDIHSHSRICAIESFRVYMKQKPHTIPASRTVIQ